MSRKKGEDTASPETEIPFNLLQLPKVATQLPRLLLLRPTYRIFLKHTQVLY